MDRKTNLFYNADSQDSNFITFSNYTESLTGNFLSTDTKLFPSTFLCLKIPKLYAETTDSYNIFKQEFIQNWLVRRYENKLAFLRDYCKKEDDLVESRLLPLSYLLEYILDYDPETEITYVDNITEQDYNGTYTDTICVINSTQYKKASIIEDDTVEDLYADYKYTDSDKQRYNYSNKYLYGWYAKYTELYRNSFDMNCDGHVDDYDRDEFKSPSNKDRIIACLQAELPTYTDAQLEDEYVKRCQEITEMAEHNALVLSSVTPTGPQYKNITVETVTIDGECTCPAGTCKMDENGKCCCKTLNQKTELKYTVDEKDSYLSPLFDYPTYPERNDYLTDDLYNAALEKYETDDKYYRITSNLKSIDLAEEKQPSSDNSIQEVEFNVIIPLYDVISMNSLTNSYIIDETDTIELQNASADPSQYIKNIPMGLWFSGKDPIVLKRDYNSKYCPTWSLVIGSQFKPFPNSSEMPDEITSSAKADAYMTFAQILTKQNALIDKMDNLFKMVNDLNSRITDVESNLASSGTSNNLDSLKQDMVDLEVSVNSQITELKNTLADMDLVWTNREG